jgi:organic hydroperoxide reductase OsmC/OhrA
VEPAMKHRGDEHRYEVEVAWTGGRRARACSHLSYGRDHSVIASGKRVIKGSADPAFHGDATRWNPEELVLGALAASHQLAYLDLCARAGVVVIAYRDKAEGVMVEDGGEGRFIWGLLRPAVTIEHGCDPDLAHSLHDAAHRRCVIASSVNFTVECAPTILVAQSLPRGLAR